MVAIITITLVSAFVVAAISPPYSRLRALCMWALGLAAALPFVMIAGNWSF